MILCPACLGSGYGRDKGPDTKFCKACLGEGEIPREMLDKYMDPVLDPKDDGDFAYDAWKDRQ